MRSGGRGNRLALIVVVIRVVALDRNMILCLIDQLLLTWRRFRPRLYRMCVIHNSGSWRVEVGRGRKEILVVGVEPGRTVTRKIGISNEIIIIIVVVVNVIVVVNVNVIVVIVIIISIRIIIRFGLELGRNGRMSRNIIVASSWKRRESNRGRPNQKQVLVVSFPHSSLLSRCSLKRRLVLL